MKNFKFKDLRVESMNFCFKSPPPKFQPQIQSIMAFLVKKIEVGFSSFYMGNQKAVILFQFKRIVWPHHTKMQVFWTLFASSKINLKIWSKLREIKRKNLFKKVHRISLQNFPPQKSRTGQITVWRDIRWTISKRSRNLD